MTTISLKLSDDLARRLEEEARRRQSNKSRLIREALTEKLFGRKKGAVSCADLAGDLVGCVAGSPDLSTNKNRLRKALRR